jgi:hypothetical protein
LTTAPYGIEPPALAVATTRSDAAQVFGEEFDDLHVTSYEDFPLEYDADSHAFVGLVVGEGADGTLARLLTTLESGPRRLTVAVAGAPLETDERDRLAAVVARMSTSASCSIQTYGGRSCLVLSMAGEPSHLVPSDVSAMLEAVSPPRSAAAEDGFAESVALRRLSAQVEPLRAQVAQLGEELAAARQGLDKARQEVSAERAIAAQLSEPTMANAWRALVAVFRGDDVHAVQAGSPLRLALPVAGAIVVLAGLGAVAVAFLDPRVSAAVLIIEAVLVLAAVTVMTSRRVQGSVKGLTAELADQRAELRRHAGRTAKTARAVEARDRQSRERLDAVEKELRGLRVRMAEVATAVRPGLNPDGSWRAAPVVASLAGVGAAAPGPFTLSVLLEELPLTGEATICGEGPATARWLVDALREQGLGNRVMTLDDLSADLPDPGHPQVGLVWVSGVSEGAVADRLAPHADVLAKALAPRSVVVADVNGHPSGQVDDLLALLPDGFVHCPTKSSTTVLLRRDPV